MPIFGMINSFIQARKQKKAAKKINPVNATYETNPEISDLYAEGKNLYQGRMAGAGAAEQNLLTNQANTLNTVQKNATSGSQALAVAAGVAGQTDQAVNDLAVKEAQDKQRRFGVYSNVSQLMAQEGDKVFQDKLRRYYDDLNQKRSLEGAAMQNQANAWGGLDNTLMAGASLIAPGGLLAGKGGGGTAGNNIPRPQMSGGTGARYNFPQRDVYNTGGPNF